MSDFEKERQEQLKKGDKMVKAAKNWHEYWTGIDYVAASIGFDTEEQLEDLYEKLDKKYGHTLAG
jgi:hypothetical protein